MKMKNLKGKRFHSLMVLQLSGEDSFHRKIWLCRCDCGVKKEIRSRHLLAGNVRTCGCKTGIDLPKPALGLKGNKHPKWKGGKLMHPDGYIMNYTENGKYELTHRAIYIKNHGSIPEGYVIHHKNGNKLDNRLCNLEALSRSEHAKHHKLGKDIR